MFHSGSPSGKGNLFITCNSFLFNRLLLQSHSFLKALLNACHLPSTILETRDTAVSVLIQPTINPAEKKYRNYYQLFQVWLQQRFSCPGSFQPIQGDTFGAEAKRHFNLLIGEWRGGCRVHGLQRDRGRDPFVWILSSARRRSSGGGWAGLCCSGCRSLSRAQGPGTGSLPPSRTALPAVALCTRRTQLRCQHRCLSL